MPCNFGGRQRFSFPHFFLDPGATPGPLYPLLKTTVAIGQGAGWASWPDLMSPKNFASTSFRTRTQQPAANITSYVIYYLFHTTLNILSFMSVCGQLKFNRGITILLFPYAKSLIYKRLFVPLSSTERKRNEPELFY